MGGVAVIALGILAGVVGGYMWKKKNTKNGKMYVVTHVFMCFVYNYNFITKT